MTHALKLLLTFSGQALVIESPLLDPRIFERALEGRPVLRSTVPTLSPSLRLLKERPGTLALDCFYGVATV
jgi:hypothetical protein